jgi:oligosaccharide repeat unit polymerase
VIRLRPAYMFWLFVLIAIFGYLHILIAVNFDIFEALRQMSLPRFSQSWGRGQYGNLYSLLYETGMLIYLIPPMAGLTYARSFEYNFAQKAFVTIVLLFTFYYGFASGTRNIMGTYVITFAVTYFLCKPQIKLWQMFIQGALLSIGLVFAMVYMLEFRTVGLDSFSFSESRVETLRVDLNMVIISRIISVFPSQYEFLGLEIPMNALIKPIPRVFWPGKPEGLSTSIESVAGADSPGMTVACTFVGEAYMAGGLIGVLFFSLLFGAAAGAWNRVGNAGSIFTRLLYVSGYLSGAIAMRSMLVMVPLMIPTVVLWLCWKFWFSRLSRRRSPVGAALNKS